MTCIRLALSGFLVFAPATAAQQSVRAADPPAVVSADKPSTQLIYAVNLLEVPGTQNLGYRPFRAYSASFNGVSYPNSLLSESIYDYHPTSRFSSVTFDLSGRYEKFEATLGRDDKEQAYGPAYCIFEVWADGERVFRSDAIRSPLTSVRVDKTFPKRSAPQSVDVSLKGVQSLRLVTRYATEFTQEARYVNRAFGCVWGNARLTLAANAQDTVLDPTLRTSVRRAALRLLPAIPRPKPGTKTSPPHLLVAPLRIDNTTRDSPLNHGETELGMRHFLADIFLGIHENGSMIAIPLAPAAEASLSTMLSVSGGIRDDGDSVNIAAKKAGADLLVFGAIEPFAGRWRVTLRLLDIRNGKTLQQVSLPIEPDPPTAETP